MRKLKSFVLMTLFVSTSLLTSCSSNDDLKEGDSSITKNIEIMNFASRKNMQDKIDEIIALKNEKEIIASAEFIKSNKYVNSQEQKLSADEILIAELKKYHTNVLNNIYDLREQIGFISIQSIADEINSLNLINPAKANELKIKYKSLLTEYQHLTVTIFDERLANVINLNGEVIVNGEKDFLIKNSQNITGKYLRDESVNSGVAASSGNLTIYYSAGREVHENDLGFKFYRYYTQLSAIAIVYTGFIPTFVPVPVTYNVDSGSLAGFVQVNSNPFSDYAFTYDYISGFGPSVRNTGGKSNTLYKPAGGNLSATFITSYTTLTCNLKYNEIP
ncbi:hypothetical protein [Flavobacterium sp. F52]|uniref:hypothetical protein n=1 Tax=Flavobacterium sp. F52 TaxID=1202532 RepID=UPI0012FBE215|nr:hypothetical protein [Flavobacterium sp. F52]